MGRPSSSAILAFVFAYLVLSVCALKAPRVDQRKKLQGPPSEFSLHRIPSPDASGVEARSFLTSFSVSQVSGSRVFVNDVTFSVDATDLMTASIFSPFCAPFGSGKCLATFFGPDGTQVTPIASESSDLALDGNSIEGTVYSFSAPAAGLWSLHMELSGLPTSETLRLMSLLAQNSVQNEPFFLLVGTDSSVMIKTEFSSYEHLTVGQNLGLRAFLYDTVTAATTGVKTPLRDIVSVAEIDVTLPDGKTQVITMHDDGLHGDLEANDGVYAGQLVAQEAGVYSAQVVLSGTDVNGLQYMRTSEHAIQIVSPYVSLTGSASASVQSDVVYFTIAVDSVQSTATSYDETVRAYTEVYGTSIADGSLVPIAWLGGMVDITQQSDASYAITLEMQMDWVALAGAQAPFSLHNTWIADRASSVPVDASAAPASVQISEADALLLTRHAVANSAETVEYHEAMFFGKRPDELVFSEHIMVEETGSNRRAFNATATNGGVLMGVHGYCAQVLPWPAAQFDSFVAFDDLRQNRNNDQFAIMLRDFGAQFPSFGIICHSQGGLASTHLHTYYWSGLETPTATPGVPVQSLGSPYQGTALAGTLASIGDSFGVGCGKHPEMTHDGAQLWLTGIPSSIRSEIRFYTTQYGTDGLIHACSVAANAVLSWPNDGVTEIKYNPLPGAQNMGNLKGWCHSPNMDDPPQYTDASRNVVLNANARR